jgi:hypothetical protein
MPNLKPDLQFSVLCDDVRREDNGKFMLIGIFEVVATRKFPSTYAFLHVVNRWCNGQGEFIQKIRLVGPDNQKVAEVPDVKIVLPETVATFTTSSVFQNIPFAQPGRYWVEVLLDDDLVQRYPLMVLELKQRPPASEKS